LGNYRLPPLDLLDEPEPVDTQGQEQRVREKAKVLEATLASFGIEGKVEAIDTGPVVTLYELSLAPGIKSSQVAALSKDIARALKSPPVRIIDNIPGKSTMGIEVPNIDRERVRLKDLFQIGHDRIAKMALPMCIGKDASGTPLIEDLTKIPHLLIAGTTGSGKSVCINSIIMTLLLTQRPDHVKLIMVDPKMVEMQDYKSIPHLMAPIIDDMSKAESILEWATQKMDERYETMSEANVRHIKEYNKLTKLEIIERFNAHTEEDQAKIQFHMPYIVIIIDELADLMMTSKEVEGHIVRIAQKARAVGIHLILATQRPEAQVVTGLIKSNMPGRICFQVRSRLDSRIMLDQSGGELLLGQGDMLMLRPTGAGLVRAQGAFVDDKEIKNVSKFLKEIAEPEFHPELMQLGTSQGLAEGEEKDPLYNEAVDIMIETGRGSVSLVQRRLNIGYSRASRLIDQMRRTGIVGAYKGSMASEVVITKEQWEVMKAENAKPHVGGDGSEGSTGGRTGTGPAAGFAQQTSSQFTEAEDDGGVPDELPGEHRQ
jgi:S-DNA-T family DNA segregation ATPase FtsK/SpoIIIE